MFSFRDFRDGLGMRRIKTYAIIALAIFVGYQLAWHKSGVLNLLPGNPLKTIGALIAIVVGLAVMVAAVWKQKRLLIVIGFIVEAIGLIYGSTLVKNIHIPWLFLFYTVLVIVVFFGLVEIVIKDKKHTQFQDVAKSPNIISMLSQKQKARAKSRRNPKQETG